MPTSQNGFPANNRALIHSVTVPGAAVRLPVRIGAAGELLVWAAARWHREVEPLRDGWNWGYAERAIRGGTQLSNHASGTAVDLNAPAHPLGTNPSANFTPTKIAAVHRIIADAQGCLRWGGDYGDPSHGGVKGSRPDGMHIEVIKPEAECARVLAIVTKTTPPPIPIPPVEDNDMTDADRAMLTEVRDLLRDVRAQLVGPDAKLGEFTGWPSFEGGTDERLTLVDYARRANQQMTKLVTALMNAVEGKPL